MENRWESQCLCVSLDAVWLRGWAVGFHIYPLARPGRICCLGWCTCVCVRVCSFMCLLVWACMPGVCLAHRRVSMSLGLCGYVCAWVSVQTVRTGIWLLSPSSTTLCHGDSCTQGQGWCGANCCRGTHCSALPACTRQGFGAGATLGAEKGTGLWAKEVVRKGLTGGTAVCCINVTLIFERYT